MWSSLIDQNGLKYSNEEINKIISVSELLHSENEKLRLELDSLVKSRQTLLEKIQENEKLKQLQQKELNKCQNSLKFEIKAREGLAKKMNIFEYEAVKYKEEYFNQKEELTLLKYTKKELEYRLNQERSKRLCELHEMDLLRKRNNELESLGSHAEKEALEAKTNLNDKLEKLEITLQQNESQKRIISAMSGEILILNSEMASIKEDLKRALEGKYHHENTISTKAREMEGLEREVSKLRRDIAVGMKGTWHNTGMNNNSIHDLFLDLDDGEGGGGRGNTAHSQPSRSGHPYSASYSSTSSSSSSTLLPAVNLNKKKSSDVITMSATPFASSYSSLPPPTSPQLSLDTHQHRHHPSSSSPSPSRSPSSHLHTFHPSELQGKRYNRNPFSAAHATSPTSSQNRQRMTSSDILTQQHQHQHQEGGGGLNSNEALSAGPKSRFTGSGLGLKKSEVPEFNPKGSAKSVLKRILKEQQDKEKR